MSAWSPNSTVEQPVGNTAEAMDFLKHWQPLGPWVLTAIDPGEKRALQTRTFRADREQEATAWLDSYQGKRNLYFSVNRPKRHLNKKAKKADIESMIASHVDVDPRDGYELQAEQERIVAMLRAYVPAPSIIIFSGGGYQGLWLLKEPIAVDDPEKLEAYNKHLASALGGDNCHNIDRIMRLPGTINLPDEKKRAKGRQIALARVIEADWNRRYSLEELQGDAPRQPRIEPDTAAALDTDAPPISLGTKKLIRGIDDPRHPYPSRSEAAIGVMVGLEQGEPAKATPNAKSVGVSASAASKTLRLTAAEIAQVLGEARRSGDGWTCRCPAHEDHLPSLSITEKNGKILVHCHAGCSQGNVVNALKARDLWPPPMQRKHSRRVERAYDYRDGGGNLRYQTVRFDPKDFAQRKINNNGSYVWNLKGVKPLCYRLPDLLSAPDRIVFVPEGERDCDSLAGIGEIATCNHGGAGKWRPEISHYLAGRDVVILSDNDDAGRKHAEDVASKLKGIASRIRIVELPDLPPKGDVSDWIAAGGTAEKLSELVAEAPDWEQGRAGGTFAFGLNDDFICDDGGGIVANSQPNIRLALSRLGVSVSFDAFALRMLVDGPNGAARRHLGEAEMAALYLLIDEQFGFRPQKEYFWMVLENEARKASFYPVLTYLSSLQWDGVLRLDNWLIVYGGAIDSPYTRAVGRLTLIAAVRRVRNPGCKFDEMPILEGPRGQNKSQAVQVLAGPDAWFSDELPLNCDDKKVIESTAGRWIVEASELKGLRKGDVEHLKAFLSRRVDRARLSYDRLVTEAPRQFLVIGTTNSDRYLRDNTGNRRFWPVKTARFDLEALQRDRDQLWAEAAHAEATGESIRLDPGLYEAAAGEQAARRVEDPWLDVLGGALGEYYGKVRIEDVWTIVDLKPGYRGQEHNLRLGDSMRELGWTRKKRRCGQGKPVWCYVRGSKTQQQRQIIVKRDQDSNEVMVWYAGAKGYWADPGGNDKKEDF